MQILGLNFSIDSAAALIRDGEVLAACQEERFERKKHFTGFPHQAIDFCLKTGEITLDDLDAVAFFWNPGIHAESPVGRFTASARHHLEYFSNVPANLLRHLNGPQVDSVEQTLHLKGGRQLNIHYVTHHVCHAASAFYGSPFEDAAILTVDGYGERQSTLIAKGSDTKIEELMSVEFPHSIGAFYAALTQFLGFRANSGEGKVMGLASYGQKSEYLDKLRPLVRLTDDGFRLDLTCFEFFHDRPARYNNDLIELIGPPRDPESKLDQRHMDIAYAVQDITEEALMHLSKIALEKTGSKNLCLSGGVGLNCVANGKLAKDAGFDKCFFYPAAGDAGSAIGAALWVYHNRGGGARTFIPTTEYLGPGYTNQEIEAVLDKSVIKAEKVDNTETVAAKMIADGQIIGWFQGRSEYGPRALGNRSILADPRSEDMKDVLNSRVKFREAFRPYAPSVLEDRSGEFFSSDVPSPFMLRAYRTLEDKLNVLPSITHVDGTARVQTVSRAQNERYYKLIEAFGKLTGVPVVLNTSFNIRGEPIVNTVEDALKCFFTTDLDALFLGDFVVLKKPALLAKYTG